MRNLQLNIAFLKNLNQTYTCREKDLTMNIITNFQTEPHLPELSEHLPEFLKSRKNELGLLQTLIDESRYDEILKIVHDWKGFCEPYGFSKLIELGNILESCAQIRNPQKCYSAAEAIKSYLKFKESSINN